ncbi:MAG: hypothetical protein AB7F64_06170 [Gammaproteobacteria bacterium]
MPKTVNLRRVQGFFHDKLSDVEHITTVQLKKFKSDSVVEIHLSEDNSTLPTSGLLPKEKEEVGETDAIEQSSAEDSGYLPLHKFYTKNERQEIERGKGYAIFLELKSSEKQVSIDAIESGLIKRGVTDQAMQKVLVDLILQDRVGFPWGSIMPVTMTLGDKGFLTGAGAAGSNEQNFSISAEVISPEHIKLHVSSNISAMVEKSKTRESTMTKIGQIDTTVDIKPNSVYLSSMKYTKVGNTEEAEKAFKIINNDSVNIFTRMFRAIKEYFSKDEEFELAPPVLDEDFDSNRIDFPASKK